MSQFNSPQIRAAQTAATQSQTNMTGAQRNQINTNTQQYLGESDATALANILGGVGQNIQNISREITETQKVIQGNEIKKFDYDVATLREQGASDQEIYKTMQGKETALGLYNKNDYANRMARLQGISETEAGENWVVDFNADWSQFQSEGRTLEEKRIWLESQLGSAPTEAARNRAQAMLNGILGQQGQVIQEDRKSLIRTDAADRVNVFTVDPAKALDPNFVPAELSTEEEITEYLFGSIGVDWVNDPAAWDEAYRQQYGIVKQRAAALAAGRREAIANAEKTASQLKVQELGETNTYDDDHILSVSLNDAETAPLEIRSFRLRDNIMTAVDGLLMDYEGEPEAGIIYRIDTMIQLSDDQRVSMGLDNDEKYRRWQENAKQQAMLKLRDRSASGITDRASKAIAFGTSADSFYKKELGGLNRALHNLPLDQGSTHPAIVQDKDGFIVLNDNGEMITDPDAIEAKLAEVYGKDQSQLVVDHLVDSRAAYEKIAAEVASKRGGQTQAADDVATANAGSGGDNPTRVSNNSYSALIPQKVISGNAGDITPEMQFEMNQQFREIYGRDMEVDFSKPLEPTFGTMAETQFFLQQMGGYYRDRPALTVPEGLKKYHSQLLAQENNPYALMAAAQLYQGLGAVKQRQMGLTRRDKWLMDNMSVDVASVRDGSALSEVKDSTRDLIDTYQKMDAAHVEGLSKRATEVFSIASGNSDKQLTDAELSASEALAGAVDDMFGLETNVVGSWFGVGQQEAADQFANMSTAFGGNRQFLDNLLLNIKVMQAGDPELDLDAAALYVLSAAKANGWRPVDVETTDAAGEPKVLREMTYDPNGFTDLPYGIKTPEKAVGLFLGQAPSMDAESEGTMTIDTAAMNPGDLTVYESVAAIPANQRSQEQTDQMKYFEDQYGSGEPGVKYSKKGAEFALNLGFPEDSPIVEKAELGQISYGEILREHLIVQILETQDDVTEEYLREAVPAASEWKIHINTPNTDEWADAMTNPKGGIPYSVSWPGMDELVPASQFRIMTADGRPASLWNQDRDSITEATVRSAEATKTSSWARPVGNVGHFMGR